MHRHQYQIYDTICTIKYNGTKDYNKEIEQLLIQMDLIFSYYNQDSLLNKLNQHKQIKNNKHLHKVINVANYYSDTFDSQYDITCLPIEETIQNKSYHPNYKNIIINDQLIKINSYQKINLNSIAKGYIADQVGEFLKRKEIKKIFINLGGNILNINYTDELAITNPNKSRDNIVCTIKAEQQALVTSGITERKIKVNSIEFNHLVDINNKTSINNNILSVSILSEKAIDADCLATACMLVPIEKSLEQINKIKNVYAIYVTKDNKIILSHPYLSQIIKAVDENYEVYIVEPK